MSQLCWHGGEHPELLGLTADCYGAMRRWRQDLEAGCDVTQEAAQYTAMVNTAVRFLGQPPLLPKKGCLEVICAKLREEIGEADLVFLSCPPELNSLPWRWLLKAEKRQPSRPMVFVVPSAAWLIGGERSLTEVSPLAIRSGHGQVMEIKGDFRATARVATSESAASLDGAADDFVELRLLCQEHRIVLDNRCFGGQAGRWRGNEWNGNPAMLLMTQCQLFVAPPCRIPVSTADRLAENLKSAIERGESMDSMTVIRELEDLSQLDPAAWLYNLYGSP